MQIDTKPQDSSPMQRLRQHLQQRMRLALERMIERVHHVVHPLADLRGTRPAHAVARRSRPQRRRRHEEFPR